MKATLLALSLILPSCAASTVPLDLPGIPAEVDPSLQLSTPNGAVGHACPVNGVVLTAHHIVFDEDTKEHLAAAYTYQGISGMAVMDSESPIQDLAALGVSSPVNYLKAGTVEPGDRVYWFEYDFRTRENALRARRRFAKVLRQVAQLIVLDEEPVPGSSGSCLINEKGEAVGVVTGGFELKDGTIAGIAAVLPQ